MKEPLMIRIRCFKEKKKEGFEGRFELNGQWKVLMFGGHWKVPMFGGPWKVPMLSGQWKEKEKENHLFTSSHFSPTNFI
jgi:hypothetical protein